MGFLWNNIRFPYSLLFVVFLTNVHLPNSAEAMRSGSGGGSANGFATESDRSRERGMSDRVHSNDVTALTLMTDAWTNARRKPPVKQLRCIGGSAESAKDLWPTRVRCYRASDHYGSGDGDGKGIGGLRQGMDKLEWKCDAIDLDPRVRLRDIKIQCEGYSSEDDVYILRGSCGLTYKLDYVKIGYFPLERLLDWILSRLEAVQTMMASHFTSSTSTSPHTRTVEATIESMMNFFAGLIERVRSNSLFDFDTHFWRQRGVPGQGRRGLGRDTTGESRWGDSAGRDRSRRSGSGSGGWWRSNWWSPFFPSVSMTSVAVFLGFFLLLLYMSFSILSFVCSLLSPFFLLITLPVFLLKTSFWLVFSLFSLLFSSIPRLLSRRVFLLVSSFFSLLLSPGKVVASVFSLFARVFRFLFTLFFSFLFCQREGGERRRRRSREAGRENPTRFDWQDQGQFTPPGATFTHRYPPPPPPPSSSHAPTVTPSAPDFADIASNTSDSPPSYASIFGDTTSPNSPLPYPTPTSRTQEPYPSAPPAHQYDDYTDASESNVESRVYPDLSSFRANEFDDSSSLRHRASSSAPYFATSTRTPHDSSPSTSSSSSFPPAPPGFRPEVTASHSENDGNNSWISFFYNLIGENPEGE